MKCPYSGHTGLHSINSLRLYGGDQRVDEAESVTERGTSRTDRWGIFLAIVVTVLCLLPFVNKAFHIDDPLFLWTARHLWTNPLDFYGFDVNWVGWVTPMYTANLNPPLNAYLLALAAFIVGWGEIGLHLVYLVFPVTVVTATYFLAKRFCDRPLIAVLAALFTPLMLVSSTNLMTDVPMLAFYLCSMALWLRGFEGKSHSKMVLAMVIACAGVLTKYFAVTVAPLLFVYALLNTRRVSWWALSLLLPVCALVGYEILVRSRYGVDPIAAAGEFSRATKADSGGVVWNTLIGLSFLGGGVAYIGFAWLLRVRWYVWAAVVAFGATVGFAAVRAGEGSPFADVAPTLRGVTALQFALFVALGFGIFALVLADLWKSRSVDSLFLATWVLGTFVFATYLNWAITGRTLLPAVPAVAILIVRRIGVSQSFGRKPPGRAAWVLALAPGALLSLGITCADYAWANAAREAAHRYSVEFADALSSVHFEGHWGFQYYMQQAGAKPFTYDRMVIPSGAVLITPGNNTSVAASMPEAYLTDERIMQLSTSKGVTLLLQQMGAGFYCSAWGPLPYAFGSVPPEYYRSVVFAPPPPK